MTSDTPSSDASPVRRMEVVTVGARQRWSEDAKRALVLETFEPGASVSAVARRRGVNPSLAFTWRKRMRAELGFPPEAPEAPMTFMPLVVADAAPTGATAATASIDVAFAGGVRVKIVGAPDAQLVAMVLRALARR